MRPGGELGRKEEAATLLQAGMRKCFGNEYEEMHVSSWRWRSREERVCYGGRSRPECSNAVEHDEPVPQSFTDVGGAENSSV